MEIRTPSRTRSLTDRISSFPRRDDSEITTLAAAASQSLPVSQSVIPGERPQSVSQSVSANGTDEDESGGGESKLALS